MLIDWFTVGAQTLNFLILVWLMKRFLYRPILLAIDRREQRIAAELADAAAKMAEAEKTREEFQHKNQQFDQERAALFNKAAEEAKAERLRLLDTARQEVDALSAKRQAALDNDAHNLNHTLSRRLQQEVFAVTRKALADLADTSLEERLGAVFTRRLAAMDADSKQGLAEVLKNASGPVTVCSAFDLPTEQRATIQNALNETFSAEIAICFETKPDLISGIALNANGWKLAWSFADYLELLENSVGELSGEQLKPETGEPANAKTKTEVKTATVEPPR